MTDIELLEKLKCCDKTINEISSLDGGDLTQACCRTKSVDDVLWLISSLDTCKFKIRLLACRFVRETPLADGRKVWDLLTDERSRKAIEIAEKWARGEATKEELYTARDNARIAARELTTDNDKGFRDAAWTAVRAIVDDVRLVARAATHTSQILRSSSSVQSDIASEAQLKMIYEAFPIEEIIEMCEKKKISLSNQSA